MKEITTEIKSKEYFWDKWYFKEDPKYVLARIKGKEFEDYRNAWDNCISVLPPYPLHIDFELSTGCNLLCKFCILNSKLNTPEFRGNVYDKLTTGKVKALLLEGVHHGLKSVQFQYVSEPFLRADILEILEYAVKIGILDVWVTTNGQLLNEDRIKRLLDIGITRLNVSLDAIKPETYKKLRGGDLEKVMNLIDLFLRLKEEGNYGLPLLRVSFIKTKINIDELTEFKDYWKDEADAIDIQDLYSFDSASDELKLDEIEPIRSDYICPQPFQRAVIRKNGDVLPCCTYHSSEMLVGNIYKNSIRQIWNNKLFNKLREQQLKGTYNKHCKECMTCLKG